MKERLRDHLEILAAQYRTGYLDSDPVGLVHALSGSQNREIGGLFASTLALGRVASIRAKTIELFDRMDGEPWRFVTSNRSPERRLKGFRHRFFGAEDFTALTKKIRTLLARHDSLGDAWDSDLPFFDALCAFARKLQPATSGIPLVASPAKGSTAKRLLMYLRWMVRNADTVDFGLWNKITPDQLVIPMDTHVFKVSRLLGLSEARTPSWKAASALTEKLRAFDPDDPVKYDFALSRIGIVHGCRARFVASVCGKCPVLPICAAAAK